MLFSCPPAWFLLVGEQLVAANDVVRTRSGDNPILDLNGRVHGRHSETIGVKHLSFVRVKCLSKLIRLDGILLLLVPVGFLPTPPHKAAQKVSVRWSVRVIINAPSLGRSRAGGDRLQRAQRICVLRSIRRVPPRPPAVAGNVVKLQRGPGANWKCEQHKHCRCS